MNLQSRLTQSGVGILLATVALLHPAVGAPRQAYEFHLPPGLRIARVAGPPEIRFPMFGALDDRGRLYVTESSGGDLYLELQQRTRQCRISVLEDRDGDGAYESTRIFARDLVPSMGLVWRDGKLYVADPPDLITLEDTDGDGVADRRSVLLTGFGHQDNGSLHGLIFGPDGWLYLTMGWPDGYRLRGSDGSWLTGKTGALLRCRPDGSGVEALCRGFDQLVEIVFLPGGQILGTQTWYQNPTGGIRDALDHLVPGGLYPQRWREEDPAPFASDRDSLPAVLLLPAVAHSGITVCRGAMFGPEHLGHIISAQFNTRKVVRHGVTRLGSTFSADSTDLVTTEDPDFRPSDVLEDADGSLLVIDTGSWYVQHCPTGRMRDSAAPGAIYRVWRPALDPTPDPRGGLLDWKTASNDELIRRLADSRPMVRDRAIEILVSRGQAIVEPLEAVLDSSNTSETAKLGAIWALQRIGSASALNALRSTLESRASTLPPPHAEVDPGQSAPPATLPQDGGIEPARASSVESATVRAMGLFADPGVAPVLETLLRHTDPAIRLASAEALAVCGRPESTPYLLEALSDNPDRILEHALIYALHRRARQADLRAVVDHSSPLVRKAALLVLDQAPHRTLVSEDVLSRVGDPDEAVRQAARFCLERHPEWASAAVGVIRTWLREPATDASGERALLALLGAFERDDAVVSVIADALNQSEVKVSAARKRVLLAFMGSTAHNTLPIPWVEALRALLANTSSALRLDVVRTMGMTGDDAWDAVLKRLASDTAEDPGTRVEALAALTRRQPTLDRSSLDLLGARLAPTNEPMARLRAAEVLALGRLPPAGLTGLIEAARADPLIAPTLVLAAAQRSGLSDVTAGPLLEYLVASVERGWPLTETQLAWVTEGAPPSARVQARKLEAALRDQETHRRAVLEDYRPVLTTGNPERGRSLFFEQAGCHACHQVAGQGRAVGPDLTKIGAIRSGNDLLESVLFPSATMAQSFEAYEVELADGEPMLGTLARQTPDLILMRNSSGAELRLPRDQIRSLTRSKLSMMPEGLLQALTRDEAADVLAYLRSLK